MKYLVPMVNCFFVNNNVMHELWANVKYCVHNVENSYFLLHDINNLNQHFFNLSTQINEENIIKVKYCNDEYLFVKPQAGLGGDVINFKFLSNFVCVSMVKNLCISVNGNVLLCEQVCNVTYSHYEIVGEMCIIHFQGKRRYLVVIKADELCCASYFDEYNKIENEQIFMCRLKDSLNHGRVFKIKDKEFSSYLVYLDDYELNLKPQFVGNVFLDCVLAKNLKYCNSMLIDNVKQDKVENIQKFFPEFDYFFAVSGSEFVLIKKNTLAGIYKFEYLENKISNIIQLDCQ